MTVTADKPVGTRRNAILPHRSVRRISFRRSYLVQALLTAIAADLVLIVKMPQLLGGHAWLVEQLLDWASVPWSVGAQLEIWPGSPADLLQTSFLEPSLALLSPGTLLAATTAIFLAGFRRWPAPLKPFLFALPASLAITLLYLKTISPTLSYSSGEFCALWYRGEVYLWLLLPWMAGLGFFLLGLSLQAKLGWLALLSFYAFIWSAVRLATGLATFHYLGAHWMPFFYFTFGFLADFLYIVAFYSLAVDQVIRRGAGYAEVRWA